MTRHRSLSACARLAVYLLLGLAASGCASRYFSPAPPTPPPPAYALAQWPYQSLWTGLVFNGAKVGFAHTRLTVLDTDPAQFRIDSEASLLLRFLGFEKAVRLRATDIVDGQLHLIRFDAAYHLDGNDLELQGWLSDGVIHVELLNAGRRSTRSIPVGGPVLPTSAILMYPALHGLGVGREYRFLAFNGETLAVAPVEQQITAFESSELFQGEAYRVVSSLHGQTTTSWLDRQGRPLLELALNGVLVSALEEEGEARRYLAIAALNKQEVMLDLSTVRVDRRIEDPRRVEWLELILRGAPGAPPSVPGQQCVAAGDGWRCRLERVSGNFIGAENPRYLVSSLTVPHADPVIRELAERIAAGERRASDNVGRILAWLDQHIRKHPADSFSALDVLETRRAECQGHSYLYAALARALGIPTRVLNGLVYSEGHEAFLFHTWTESWIDGAWRAIDPTFGQPLADATHLLLAEGEEPADLVALTDWVGRLSIEIVGYGHGR
jgi:hypothetical protein